ncbi:MAG: 4Fe-4S dicluster domain-containing protein [Candidatus Hodarchaeales archaeon]|jgi:heterodisulfide reductase subunit C
MIESTDLITDFKHLYDKVKQCYQCGTCAGGCPVFEQYYKFNPRRIMETLLLGEFSEEIFEEQQIWYCTELKNMAAKLNNVPPGIITEMDAILESGSTAAISQSILKKREKLELPILPKPDMNEIQKLMDAMGVTNQLRKLKEVTSE